MSGDRPEDLVNERLRELINATEDDIAADEEATQACVLLRLDKHWFAVAAHHVSEVVSATDVTRVPASPAGIEGVVLVHDRLLPVVDLYYLTGIAAPTAKSGRLLVLVHDGEEAATLAEEVRGVEMVPLPGPTSREPPISGEGKFGDRQLWYLDARPIVGHGSEVE